MSEIVCPNCGNSNPPEAEFCEMCQALLKHDDAPDSMDESNSSGWLDRIRERSQAEKPETPPLGDFGEAEDRPFDQPPSVGDIPDWLKEIQQIELPQQKNNEPAEEVDWIAKLHEIQKDSDRSFSQSTTFYSDEELAALAAAKKKEQESAAKPSFNEEESKTILPTAGEERPPDSFEQSLPEGLRGEQSYTPQSVDDESPSPSLDAEEASDQSEEQPIPSIDESTFAEKSPNAHWEETVPQTENISGTEPPGVEGSEKVLYTEDFEPDFQGVKQSASNLGVEEEKISGDKSAEPIIPEALLQPHYSRAVEYSGRLAISESQRNNIMLLKSMLVGEIQSTEPSFARGKFSGRVMRLVLGVILLIIMSYPFFTNFTLVKPQALFAPGVVAMHNTITNLPANAPFLVVADFEPAFSGEMRSAAIGVIDNLMMKEMNFTVVSTVPAGPALANDLLTKTRPASFAYPPEKIAILGYIPGGTTGLQDFIRKPRLAAPLLETGAFAWTYPAAQAVNVIQDYVGVLVITENAETGRAWVEQLHGQLGGKPLLMVVSAQSAPIMRPYLDSGQLNGLISGRVEGAMYDRLMDAPPRSQVEMSSYQMGMLLAAILVFVGGLYGLLKKMILRQPVGSSEDWHGG